MAAFTAAAQDTPHTWRVWVTDEDVHRSRAAWVRARDCGAPTDRVRDLLEEFERLSRTAILQAAGDPWSGGPWSPALAVVPTARALHAVPTRPLLSVAG